MHLTETTHQARWRHLFDSLPQTHFVFLLDKDGRYLDLRVPDPRRLWIPQKDHIGKTFDEVLPPELGKDRRYYFDKALATGRSQQYSYPHPITKGRHMTCRITPIKTGEEIEVLMQVFDTALAEVPAANVLPDL